MVLLKQILQLFYSGNAKQTILRVETKDFYTGKGWEVSENQKKVTFKNKNDVVSWYEQNTKTETTKATITMQKGIRTLPIQQD